MLRCLKTLLLLAALLPPASGLCFRLPRPSPALLCGGPPGGDEEPGYPGPGPAWGPLLQEYFTSSSSSSDQSSRERRTSSPANYRFVTRTKLRGQMLRGPQGPPGLQGPQGRRGRLTLSLDVPTNIMNVLFDVAKAKHLRAKAAENARLLAQIGRRK